MSADIEERVVQLESEVQLLKQDSEHKKDMTRLLIDDMTRLLTRHDHILIGSDGVSGLVSDVNMLKQEKIGERLKSLEVTVIRWGGGLSIAAFMFPILLKVFWP